MKIKALILSILFFTPIIVGAQTSGSYWYPVSSKLTPTISSYGLKISQLGGSGVSCVQVDNTGIFSVTGSGCISSSNRDWKLFSSTVLTTTSTPMGILVNNSTSTITNLMMVNSTSTNATSTNLVVSTGARINSLFVGNTGTFNPTTGAMVLNDGVGGGAIYFGSGNGDFILSSGILFSEFTTFYNSGLLEADNLKSFGNLDVLAGLTKTQTLWVTASTTLQNFTGLRATTTAATSTNSFATTASSTNLFTSNLGVSTTTPVAKIGSYTTASTTNLLLESISGTGGCLTIKDVGSALGYTQIYTQGGVLYSKVATSLATCN